jgi:hypothetical protein
VFYLLRWREVRLRGRVRTSCKGDGYELVVDRPDAMARIERFEERASLGRRWTALEQTHLRVGGTYSGDA